MVTSLGWLPEQASGSAYWCEAHHRVEFQPVILMVRFWCYIHQRYEYKAIEFWEDDDETGQE